MVDLGKLIDKIHEGIRKMDKNIGHLEQPYNQGYDAGKKAAYEDVLRWLGE